MAINVDRDRADADQFLKSFTRFRHPFDPRGDLAEQYKVQGMPTSMIIDRHGVVRFTHVGFRPVEVRSKRRYGSCSRKSRECVESATKSSRLTLSLPCGRSGSRLQLLGREALGAGRSLAVGDAADGVAWMRRSTTTCISVRKPPPVAAPSEAGAADATEGRRDPSTAGAVA